MIIVYIHVLMLTVCFEEEGIISGCVSQDMLSFICGRIVGANVDYTRRLCWFLHELFCYLNYIIVVCSVYVARFALDMSHVQCCQGNS